MICTRVRAGWGTRTSASVAMAVNWSAFAPSRAVLTTWPAVSGLCRHQAQVDAVHGGVVPVAHEFAQVSVPGLVGSDPYPVMPEWPMAMMPTGRSRLPVEPAPPATDE